MCGGHVAVVDGLACAHARLARRHGSRPGRGRFGAPPSVPPEAEVFDLPTSATMRSLWVGTYTGMWGRAHISARHDSLIVALEGQELGRLLCQGGSTFVASWDHGTRIVFGAGGVPVAGFTVS